MSDSIFLYLRGGLGNQLFQLALGNILAQSLGRKLSVGGKVDLISAESYPRTPAIKGLDLNRCEVLSDHVIYRDQLIKAQKHHKTLVLDGWFQRYSYYAQHKAGIINLFRDSLFNRVEGGNESELVFHIRTTNYRRPNVRARYMMPLSINYFRSAFQSRTWQKAYIVTDDREDELVLAVQALTNAEIISNNQIDDFNFIRNSKNIVLSTSTFSWWAAWLSNANTIYLPRKGNWNPLLRPDLDFRVPEKRYVYQNAICLLHDYWVTHSSPKMPKSKQLRKYIAMSISAKRAIYRGESFAPE